MQLGSSMRRRRGRGDDEAPRASPRSPRGARSKGRREGRGVRLLAFAAGVVVLGFGVGWLVATRVLFPPPPPPGDYYEVPDVYGLEAGEAARRIQGVGLTLGLVDHYRHPAADSGRVVGQDPLPGQLAAPGEPVRISVSLGIELRAVPNVAQLRADRARLMLETSGFMVVVDSVESRQPRGRVISIEPPPGSQLAVPGEVRLAISVGPPQVGMPLVIGLEEAQARDTLQALGFLLSAVEEAFGFDAQEGQVVGQDPPAGRQMELGSAVRIVIGREGQRPDTLPAPAPPR
jgi:eukaryotic-like serine/threonine-protein kinase